MPTWHDLAAVVLAYLIGCIATAYYAVRLRTGQDIRELGSGNVGGRNAGRVLGRSGFALVSVIDALKGVAAVLLARALGASEWALVAALIAVVAGHIWPIQLRFQGGKGAATVIGTLAAYNYLIAAIVVAFFVVFFALFRSFTIAGLLALALTPLVLIFLGLPWSQVIATVILVVLVLFAHRENIREKLHTRSSRMAR